MGPVMERGDLIVVPSVVAVLEVLLPGGVEGSDRFGEVAVVVGGGQVDLGVLVVGQDPREYRVLVQVVVGAAWNGIF